jgi:hypothetical protein
VAAAGARTVKTHSGLSALFSQALHQCAPQHLDLEGELTRAFNARLLVDYDDGGSDPVGKAIALVGRAPAYVESCKRIAESLQSRSADAIALHLRTVKSDPQPWTIGKNQVT